MVVGLPRRRSSNTGRIPARARPGSRIDHSFEPVAAQNITGDSKDLRHAAMNGDFEAANVFASGGAELNVKGAKVPRCHGVVHKQSCGYVIY